MNFEIFKKVFSTYIVTVGKRNTFFVFLFGFFVSLVISVEPLFFSEIIGQIEQYYKTGEKDTVKIITTIIYWSIFIMFNITLMYLYRFYVTDVLTLKNYKRVFLKYTKKVFNMHYGDYLGKKAGSIFKNFDRGAEVHFILMFDLFNQLIRSLFSITIIVIILFVINWQMALIALSMLPVMLTLGFYFNKVTTPKQKKLNERWDRVYGIVGDSMNNFLLFKTLNLDILFYNKINKSLAVNFEDQLQISKQWSISDIYTSVLIMISRVLVLSFGVYFLYNDKIDFYTLFVVFSYLGWIYFPLGAIFSMLKRVQENLVAAERFYDEFDNMKKDLDAKKGTEIIDFSGNIEFKDVEFSYIKNRKVFKKLSFKIDSGEKIAFVGNTGAGKSSIVNLILRFWDPDKGEILFDNKDSYKLDKRSIRRHIGIVAQDNSLFNLSIRENLSFAKHNTTDKEIKKALSDAQAEFVYDLEDGIDTVIGERGLKLSGGEKQRISIARLFLKNPEILILDEATSALDNKTEKLIQKALDKLMKGRTSIVIAHRLSTIQNADRIFMLENGEIIEMGTYEDLMSRKEKFYHLANPEHLILQ